MEASGKGLLKVTGILMIVFGAIAIILNIVTLIGSFVLLPLLGSLVLISSILGLIGSGLELATGIVGVKNAKDVTKAKPCIVLSGIIILLAIISFILNICTAGFTVTPLISFLLGLVIPALYLWGALKNQEQAEAKEYFDEINQ